MNKTLLSITNNNIEVYIETSTLEHMKAHPDVSLEIVAEAISKLNYREPFYIGSVEMETIIGKDNCVPVTENDEVKNLYRKGREGRTPIVFNKEPMDTNLVTVGICLDEDGKNTMFTAFYGVLAPKEPWDKRLKESEREEAKDFWKHHAIVMQEGILDEGIN